MSRLSRDLESLLDTGSGAISIGSLVDRIGEKGFGLLLIVLASPSALPVPAPGYSIPFGIMLALVAFQMMAGRTVPVLPERFRRVEISRGMAKKIIGAGVWFFGKMEWFIRPRLRWVGSYGGRIFMAVLVLIMATLMMIPIPLTNTAPAMVIFLIGIGLAEEDGLFACAACAAGVAAVVLYGGFLYAFIVYGPEVVTWVKDWIRGWF